VAKDSGNTGWMPPRGGGYRPGKNTASASAKSVKGPAPQPPKGGAGISKSKGGSR
jgi:hypothetical protein